MKTKKALITGITGQDGSYLAELLLGKGYEVWGIVRRNSTSNMDRINHLYQNEHEKTPCLQLRYGDLGDASSLHSILNEAQPDEVYNLAAQSHVKVSFEVPEYTGDITGLGTTRLLSAIYDMGLKDCRFYQASSSELYGAVLEVPQTETTPFNPCSPYAIAKAYAFYMTRNFRESYGMFAVNGILFNHESPRRGKTFVTRKISHAVAKIKLGLQDCVYLGNMNAKRDWGFAGDYVEGMWRMLQADEPNDFVLATGETYTVRDFCDLCFAEVGLPLTWEGADENEQGIDADGRVLVKVDPAYFRPAEVNLLLGDPSKAKRLLGWEATMNLQGLVSTMVSSDVSSLTSKL